MNILLYSFFILISQFSVFGKIFTKEYLQQKLMDAKIEIAKSYIENDSLDFDTFHNITYSSIFSRLFKNPNTKPIVTNIFDKTYIIEGNNVYLFDANADLKYESSLHQTLIYDDEIQFIQNIIWRNKFYLVICYKSGLCVHYISNNAILEYQQTVHIKGFPSDARFFILENSLYLVLAVAKLGPGETSSKIYHMIDGEINFVAEVVDVNAISVETFNYNNYIVVILGTEVYYFQSNEFRKIQDLPTEDPWLMRIYVYRQNTFLLVVHQFLPTEIFWWDGKQFIKWMDTNIIKPSSFIQIVFFNNYPLFFVSEMFQNNLKVLTMHNGMYVNLQTIILDNKYILDMKVKANDVSLTAILVTLSNDNYYYSEVVKYEISEINEKTSTWNCLKDLNDKLTARMPTLERLWNTWSSLSTMEKDSSLSHFSLPDVTIESKNIGTIELLSNEITFPGSALNFQTNLNSIEEDLRKLTIQSQKISNLVATNFASENVFIEGDAYFEELYIDNLSVNIINNQTVDINKIIHLNREQNFSSPLKGKNIVIDNLIVDQLCNIPFDNWYRKIENCQIDENADDGNWYKISEKNSPSLINWFKSNLTIENDTIILYSDLNVENINTDELNDINLKAFFNEMFVLNQRTVIQGNITFSNKLHAVNLDSQYLNGVHVDSILTQQTSQNISSYYIHTVEVDDLQVQTVNGISPNNAARVSKANEIKGHVTMDSLVITDELSIDKGVNYTKANAVQIYESVKIKGNLILNNLYTTKYTNLISENELVHIPVTLDNFWTKSTPQVINVPVTFSEGITIDEMDAPLLNGLQVDKYIFTTDHDIPELLTDILHFNNFHADNGFIVEGSTNGLIEVASNVIMFDEPVHLAQLKVQRLRTPFYNKIPIEGIQNNVNLKIPNNLFFTNVTVKGELIVDDLETNYIDGLNVLHYLSNVLYADGNYEVNDMEMPVFHADNIKVDVINDNDVSNNVYVDGDSYENDDSNNNNNGDEDYLEGNRGKRKEIINITIDGDLLVTGNLQANYINDDLMDAYLFNLQTETLIAPKNTKFMDKLTIHGNLNVKQLNGFTLHDLCNGTLKRRGDQLLLQDYFFNRITAGNVSVEFINDVDLSKAVFVDENIVIDGNVTFSELRVQNNVTADNVNSYGGLQFSDVSHRLFMSEIENLTVIGNISWDRNSDGETSVSNLLNHAVTRDSNQVIHAPVTFNSKVLIGSLNITSDSIDDVDIKNVIEDAVLYGTEAFVLGKKTFRNQVVVDNLISNEIAIAQINDWNMLNLNVSIVRKCSNDIIYGEKVFKDVIKIDKLKTNKSIHNVKLNSLISSADEINHIHFEKLLVKGNVFTQYLDGIDFEKFVNERLTLNENHEIFGNVEFHNEVTVLGNALINNINGIHPSDFVLNHLNESQIVTGKKTFTNFTVIDANIKAPLLNSYEITMDQEKRLNDTKNNVIYGDIIFKNKFITYGGFNTTNLINGLNCSKLFNEFLNLQHEVAPALYQTYKLLHGTVSNISMKKVTMSKPFFYLEDLFTDNKLKNVNRIEVDQNNIHNFNIYSKKPGSSCGLPNNCSCRHQSSLEFSEDGLKIKKSNETKLSFKFSRKKSIFLIDIYSNVTSYSKKCFRNSTQNEITLVSWKKRNNLNHYQKKDKHFKIEGYLSDVKVINHKEKIYIILALYYNKSSKNRKINSLMLQIDWTSEKLESTYELKINKAKNLHIVEMSETALYILITGFREAKIFRFNYSTSEMQLLQSIPSYSQHLASMYVKEDANSFIFLDDSKSNSLIILSYDYIANNYKHFQTFAYKHPVNSISILNNIIVSVSTSENQLYIYEYRYIGKFQKILQFEIDYIKTAMFFSYGSEMYMFIGTEENSRILKVIT